ncbi:MAG: aminomethyltransferase family protein [Actinomycetota bacterium]|jgi:aminomethyltransferase|nr:aminomethyltransferase family protein [Actinomycetota bacterium]
MAERRTALYDAHVRAGAQMVKGGGDFWFPFSYTSAVSEHVNTRSNIGMQDLSSMGEVDVKGPGAERLLNRLLVNEIRDMDPGRVRYSTICNPDGGIVDDVTVYKFHDEHFMVVTSSGPRLTTYRWIAEHAAGTGTYVTDVTATIAFLSVQGPKSREFLRTVVTEADLDDLRFFRFTTGRIDETEMVVSRSGYTGELGFELYVPADEAVGIWERLRADGKEFGLKPYGAQAMHTLRLEKALPLYGPDINQERTPFHVGLDRWIRFDKRDFVGRDALLAVQDSGPEQRWVGLRLDAKMAADPGDAVSSVGDVDAVREEIESGPRAGELEDHVHPGERLGDVTTSQWCPTVEQHLAMAYLDTSHAWPGSRVVIEHNGRPVTATVVPTPFFDPGNVRMKG